MKTERKTRKRKKKTTRVQFEYTDDVLAMLDEAEEKSNSSSRAEAVRKVLKYYLETQKLGPIGIEKDGKFCPIIVLL